MKKTHLDEAREYESRPPSTRDLILDEAERLIAMKGIYGFTLKDIADPLDVQVPAIYKHFKSRDDVLVELSRRFITALSSQFSYRPDELASPTSTLHKIVDEFCEFHIGNPAYVRLSLVDFATPEGGMEYIRLAAGGAFHENLSSGPLYPMHNRLKRLIAAGQRTGEFRSVTELTFYRVIKASLLICLVFPDDLLISNTTSPAVKRSVKSHIWDVAYHHVAAHPAADG